MVSSGVAGMGLKDDEKRQLRRIIQRYRELKNEINSWSTTSGTVSTGAGAVGIIGGACTMAAPFSGGTSLLVGGIVCGVASGVTSLGVGHQNSKKDAVFKERLEALDEDLRKWNDKLHSRAGDDSDALSTALQVTQTITAGIEGVCAACGVTMTSTMAATTGGTVLKTTQVGGKTLSTVTTEGTAITTGASAAGKTLGVVGGGLCIAISLYEGYNGVCKLASDDDKVKFIDGVVKVLEDVEDR